ncbi:NAD(P)H-dependent flavin oxidoreductase [Henriciella mobilis]|uniref:Nitronate monooxygenase n=1 Tax=Henriciella mobilis TaxID=2305467 RepID=A0A399RJ21_9PROT|nr:nitronate monooxygenase [Henriciella mobilis]RIJ29832.1 nitronate monooxygenase [Henriciella mobilis]
MSSRIAQFGLRLPLMAAPMSIASVPALIKACMEAGIIGCFPTHNAAQDRGLRAWVEELLDFQQALRHAGGSPPTFAVNINVSRHKPADRLKHEISVCRASRLPIITSNAGNPAELVKQVHDWGGIVIHDATTVEQAEKAVAVGVDGLMLVCAGAGGLGGLLSPFAFVPAVRRFFDGIIQLAGGVASGEGIAAAELLGADMVCMGTRFIATKESGVPPGHKQMLAEASLSDVCWTERLVGIGANFLKPSLTNHGIDPNGKGDARYILPDGVKPWRDVWSGGHSTALVDDILSVEDVISKLEREYVAARSYQIAPVD